VWTTLGLLPQDQRLGGPSYRDRNEWAAVMIFSDSDWLGYSATVVRFTSPASEMAAYSSGALR
jgi:hypothetical protein